MADGLDADGHRRYQRVLDDLKARGQYDEVRNASDTAGVQAVRALGRRVARDQGWKVRTFATETGDTEVKVIVVITQSSPLHEELLRTRSAKTIRQIFSGER